MVTSYAAIRDCKSRLLREHFRCDPPYGMVARLGEPDRPRVELLRVWNPDTSADLKYYLLTDERELAILGATGLVESYRKDGKVLAERTSAYGFLKPDVALERTLDHVYATIAGLGFDSPDESELFAWRAQSVLARFGDFSALYHREDIIAEFTDRMIAAKISDRCKRACRYCRQAGGFVAYAREQIVQNMLDARKLEEKHHGPHLELMTEGFLNGSDLLWYRKRDPTPLAIVQDFMAIFPEVEKLYAFMGVPNVLAASARELERLGEAGLSRILVGIESFHHPTSRFLGKAEPPEDKVAAIEKLHRIGFKVKPIVQVGAVGRGFTFDGNSYSEREGLEETARVATRIVNMDLYSKRPRVKLLVSRHIPDEETPLARDPRVVPYGHERELEEDVAFFIDEMRKGGAHMGQVELDYEAAIQRGVREAA